VTEPTPEDMEYDLAARLQWIEECFGPYDHLMPLACHRAAYRRALWAEKELREVRRATDA